MGGDAKLVTSWFMLVVYLSPSLEIKTKKEELETLCSIPRMHSSIQTCPLIMQKARSSLKPDVQDAERKADRTGHV